MELFARCDREPERLLAVTEEGRRYTLGDLNAAAGRLGRAVGGHRLVFLLCENTPGSLLGYFACLRTGAVPLLLDARIAPAQLAGLMKTYRPAFVLAPGDLPDETRALLSSFTPALELEGQALGEVLCSHSGRIQGLNESQSLLQNRGWQADRLGQIR